MKESYFSEGFCPYTLFTRPEDASPIVFCMNEGPEYFRLRVLINESGGILEKAPKFDSSGRRIRIHDRKMVALEKETDIFCLSYITDCLKEDALLPNLEEYRLGKSLFADYDPFDILMGHLTWKDLQREGQGVVSQVDDDIQFRRRTAGHRAYTTSDQVAILNFLIQHKKFNALQDIKTWRSLAASGVVSGDRSETSLKEHFKKQILPKIHVKTFPQFAEEDLNMVIQGWRQKQDYYAPPPLDVKVVERPTLRPRVNFNLPSSSPRRKGSQRTPIDESGEESDEINRSPIEKRKRLSPPLSPSYSMPSSLKASQIFSNEIQEASQEGPSSIPNYFDSFPPELREFFEKGSEALNNAEPSTSKETVSRTRTLVSNYELRENGEKVREEIISGALSETDPPRGNPLRRSTRISQSLHLYSSQMQLEQSTQKELAAPPNKDTRIVIPFRKNSNKPRAIGSVLQLITDNDRRTHPTESESIESDNENGVSHLDQIKLEEYLKNSIKTKSVAVHIKRLSETEIAKYLESQEGSSKEEKKRRAEKEGPYSAEEDEILTNLLGKGHVSGFAIKALYMSKVLPGRSMRSIKNRLRELKHILKKEARCLTQ